MRALLLLVLLAPGVACAQLSVSVFGVSKHSEPGYCEVNPGLGVSYQVTESVRLGHARFRNSQCRPSNGTGLVWDPIKLGRFSFGIALLRVTGYHKKADYVPLPVGAYRVERDLFVDFFVASKDETSVT